MTDICNMQTLPNGIQLLLIPTDSKVTTLNITYRVGSRNEGLCQTGDTHILEHMMFGGSKKYSGNKGMWSLEEQGAILNATTYLDRTNYYEVLQTKHIPHALDLEADRMLQPTLSPEKLKSEMTVVRNEYERGANNPFANMNSKMMQIAFNEHPYGHSTIGYLADIEHVNAENLKQYHKKYYKPNNATIILTGNIPENAAQMVQDKFKHIPPGNSAENFVIEPTQQGIRRFQQNGPAGIVGIGFKAPNGLHPDAIELELLAYNINNKGIFDHLVNNGTLYNVSASWQRMKDPFLFTIWASAPDPHAAEQAIWKIIQQKPKIQLEKKALKQLWTSQTQSSQGLAAEINEAVARGDWKDVWNRHEIIDQCNGKNMWKYFNKQQATVGIMANTNKSIPISCKKYKANEVNIQKQQTNTATFQKTTQGLFMTTNTDTVNLKIEYNSEHPTPVKAIFADMITKGSGNIQPDKIQQVMGSNGVIRHTEVTAQGYALQYVCPANSIDLIITELSKPLFNKKELQRSIKNHTQEILAAQDNTDIHVINILKNKLFNTPMPSENIRQIKQIAKLQYTQKPSKITAAGPKQAIQKIKQLHINGFKPQQFSSVQNTGGDYHHTVEKKSCAVVWGCAVQPTAVLKVATSILGGGFAGRLMKKVRDKDGLTYGIYANIKDNLFLIKTSFNPAMLKQGIESTEEQIQMWRHGVTPEELKTHKDMITGQRAILQDDMAKYIHFMHDNKISDQEINSVTLEEVNQALANLPKLYRVSSGPTI